MPHKKQLHFLGGRAASAPQNRAGLDQAAAGQDQKVNGSWHNQQIAQQNQQLLVQPHTAAYSPVPPAQPAADAAKPLFAPLRRFLALLLALLTLLLAGSAAGAYWAQSSIVDPQGFAAISMNMAENKDFQAELAQAVTQDIMASEALSQYLGNGQESGLWGNVQNWARQQVESGISTAAQTVVEAESYPDMWKEVMADTHDYNMQAQGQGAALDLSALYKEIGQQTGTVLGVDTSQVTSGEHLLPLVPAKAHPLGQALQGVQAYAASWPVQLALAGLGLLLGLLLWPGNRCYYLAFMLMLAGAGFWLLSLGSALLASSLDSLSIPSSVGQVFMAQLASELASSFKAFMLTWVAPALIAGVLFFFLGLALQLTKFSVRAVTGRA